MNKNKFNVTVLLFFLVLCLLPFSSSATDEPFNAGIIRAGDSLNLYLGCSYNGTSCDSSALCNTTILYPNKSILVLNARMGNASLPQFNITPGITTILGRYDGYQLCCQAGSCATDSYYYTITNTGTEVSIAQAIIYFISLLLLVSLFCLCFYWALNLPWDHPRDEEGFILKMNDLRYLKIFMWFMSYVVMIGISWLAYNITWGLLDFNVAGNFFNFIYWTLISFFFPIIVVFMIMALVNFVTGKKLQNAIKGGIRLR